METATWLATLLVLALIIDVLQSFQIRLLKKIIALQREDPHAFAVAEKCLETGRPVTGQVDDHGNLTMTVH